MIPEVPKYEAGRVGEGNSLPGEALSMTQEMALLAADENRELLTVALAARLLGKSRDTIYRWLAEGRLRARKVGGRWLVYRDSVEAEWKAGLVEEN